jgi:hypothetical protein
MARRMSWWRSFQNFDVNWKFQVIDLVRRVVAFSDETTGKVTLWKWDFGDGVSATEQNPIHQYAKGGDYTVVLEVEGPQGKSRREKIWDVGVGYQLLCAASATPSLRVEATAPYQPHSWRFATLRVSPRITRSV